MDIRASRLSCYTFLFLLAFMVILSLWVPPAYADGGAPQLAYVAGTAQGVSVIDIAQRRVTSTIAITGNPRTVLLSPDGQDLYVAQPEPGRVSVLAAISSTSRLPAALGSRVRPSG